MPLTLQPDSSGRTSIRWLMDGGFSAGHVLLESAGSDTVALDVRLADLERAPEVLDRLLDHARSAGSSHLVLATQGGDPGHESLLAVGEFTLFSQNMVARLSEHLAPPSGVQLRPMTEEEFAVWRVEQTLEYAQSRERNGEPPEVARLAADESLTAHLPQGLATPQARVWVGEADGVPVGTLWVDFRSAFAFIFKIEVDEAHRGRGHGRALMQAAARESQHLGATAIKLNVFGDNQVARSLYLSLGYEVTTSRYRMPVSSAS